MLPRQIVIISLHEKGEHISFHVHLFLRCCKPSLGSEVSTQYTSQSTQLMSNTVRSQKYHFAASGRRPNLRPGAGSDAPGIWLTIFCRSSGKHAIIILIMLSANSDAELVPPLIQSLSRDIACYNAKHILVLRSQGMSEQ